MAGSAHPPIRDSVNRLTEKDLRRNQWIPAPAGMTEEGVSTHAVRTIIPAPAGNDCKDSAAMAWPAVSR